MKINYSATKELRVLVSVFHLIGCVFLLSGCKVYFDAAEADKQLREVSVDAENNSNRLTQQIKSLQMQYEELNCNQQSETFLNATKKMEEINLGLNDMNTFSRNIKEEHSKFTAYVSGKSKIESGTPEWKQFKQTRSNIKEYAKQLQKTGNENVSKATEFHRYVEEKIVPEVKYCDVSSTLNQFETTLRNVGSSQRKFVDDLRAFEKKVNEMTQTDFSFPPEKVKTINELLKKMSASNTDINKVKSGILQQTSAFRKATSGKTKVYSCSSDWEAVTKAQKEFNRLSGEMNTIEQGLQQISAQIQNEMSGGK